MQYCLFIKGTDTLLLRMSDAQFSDLTRYLQKEHNDDKDFFIDKLTLEYLENRGCDAALVAAIRASLPREKRSLNPYRERAPMVIEDEMGDEKAEEVVETGGVEIEWRICPGDH